MSRISKNNVFKSIEVPKVGRSVFPLSYEKKFTGDMGKIYPVLMDEVIPGDHWKIGCQYVIRFSPLVNPIIHEVTATLHLFFVPSRLLWDDFEDFATGGVTGDETPVMPRWDVSQQAGSNAIGTLWDYVGLPTGVDPSDCYPIDLPRRAYYLIWNEYYRDQNLQEPLDITDYSNYQILNRAWEKDYFTSALLWQQRGTPPAVPIAGTASAVFDSDITAESSANTYAMKTAQLYVEGISPYAVKSLGSDGTHNGAIVPKVALSGSTTSGLDDNTIDLTGAAGPTISDLRAAFQLQKFLERMARGGSRYTEFLQAVYGVGGNLDARLQRPEFFGGMKSNIIVSEVLQTSQTTTGDTASPQGNMAGHGIGVNTQYCGSYYAKEFGYIVGLLSVMPKPAYQQGINKQWLRFTRTDLPNPLFAHLSEQAVLNAEIYAQAGGVTPKGNLQQFGYQGIYNEMRYKPNMVCGLMRTDFDSWHLGRQFASLPELTAEFITCDVEAEGLKRIFAVENEPGLIINWANLITAVRPIPINPSPGYIDHF